MNIKSITAWQENKHTGYTIVTDCGKVFVADPINPEGYIMHGKKFKAMKDCEDYIKGLKGEKCQ